MIITTVELLDLMSQLGKETVVEYTSENATIDTIVTQLLALQILTPEITKGTISDSIKNLKRSIKVDGDTILRALLQLRNTVGGYINVDDDRKLNWLDSIGEDKGQQIRYRKNLKGIEREINYDGLVNKLYCYGAGEGEARIELSDVASLLTGNANSGQKDVAVVDGSLFEAGIAVVISDDDASEDNEIASITDNTLTMTTNLANTYTTTANAKVGRGKNYVEDVTSQGAPPGGWGGVYKGSRVDRRITHPNTLLAWAHLLLEDYKSPPIYYRIDTLDLSQSKDSKFAFDALKLGSKVTVIDEDLGIDVSVIIAKMEHPDLLHPEQVTLELANCTKDITDTLSEVYDAQQLREHIATRIGAGQVVISGEVTIQSWIPAGKTTIDGAKIETGTIIADAIGAGTITGKTIIISGAAGILKSSNYVAASAGWQIKGNGIAEFNEVIVRGAIHAGAGSVIDFGYVENGPPADAEANPDYIHSTYIASTQIKSPNISGTTGYFSNVFKVGSGGIIIDGGSKLIKSSNYSAGSAGWQIRNTGDAEFNSVVVRGTVYATAGEFTGTLKVTNIQAGRTLTVNGVISAGGGKVILNSTGLILKGNVAMFKTTGDASRGAIYADADEFGISSASGIKLVLQATNQYIWMLSNGVVLPHRTSAPTPWDGILVYDDSDGHLKYYSAHDSTWFRVQRTGGWG